MRLSEQPGSGMPVGHIVFGPANGTGEEWLSATPAPEAPPERGTPSMGPEHEAHLARVNDIFAVVNAAKYRRGQEEHGGRLWEKDLDHLLLSALMENIDGMNYILSVLEQRGIGREEILAFIRTEHAP